jgi:transcriptional regulator with XRE-family HTH domain
MAGRGSELAALGRAIRELRQRQRMSTADLAERVRSSPERIEAIESGKYAARFDLLVAVARALRVDLSALAISAEAPDTRAVCAVFGRRIRSLRERHGVSQEAFALRVGLHRTAISKLERGTTDPRMTTILRLALGLGVSPGELLDDLDRLERHSER